MDCWSLRHSPEAALAAVEFADGGPEVGAVEIGPHAAGEDQLGVGAFPQQEVAETLLAAGADEEIDRRAERSVEGFTGELGRMAGGGEDGVAAGVVDGDTQAEVGSGGGFGFGAGDAVAQRGVEAVAAADHFEA